MEIELKQWCSQYKIELIKLCNEVNRNYISNRLPLPYSEEDADWWLDKVSKDEGDKGIFRAILLGGKLIGNISIEKKHDVFEKDAEIGYMLFAEDSANGYMTNAVSQICDIAFKELDLKRITGLVYEPNKASMRVLEKNDFVLEGIMKDAVCKNGNIYDLCIYGKYLEINKIISNTRK